MPMMSRGCKILSRQMCRHLLNFYWSGLSPPLIGRWWRQAKDCLHHAVFAGSIFRYMVWKCTYLLHEDLKYYALLEYKYEINYGIFPVVFFAFVWRKIVTLLCLKVLSNHLNWGARLDSFDPLLNTRWPASLKFFF